MTDPSWDRSITFFSWAIENITKKKMLGLLRRPSIPIHPPLTQILIIRMIHRLTDLLPPCFTSILSMSELEHPPSRGESCLSAMFIHGFQGLPWKDQKGLLRWGGVRKWENPQAAGWFISWLKYPSIESIDIEIKWMMNGG